MSEKATMDAKTKKVCPNCSQFYQLKPANSKSIPTIPLFLACGHSTCEKCIRNLLKFEEPIECKVCLKDMEITASDSAMLKQDKISLYKLFPINVYMVGELTLEDIEAKEAKKGPTDNEHYIDIKSIINNTEQKLGECLECHGPTPKMCQQCGITLCDSCFNKTHKNFIIFKNHSLQKIENISPKETCNIHRDKALDYYCKDCKKSVCMNCLILQSCKNHDTTSIQEVNEMFVSEIVDLTPKADETLRRLTKTAVEIGNLLAKIDNDLTSSEYMTMLNNIEQHFSKINAIIQKQKDEITNRLLELKNIEKESLQEAKTHVAEAIKKAKSTLNAVTSLDAHKLNMAVLLEDVKQVINTPWYLNRDEPEININITVKEDVYESLSDFIVLEGDPNPIYKLCTTTELTEKNEDIPAAPASIVYPPELIKDVRLLNKQKPKEESAKQHTFVKDIPTYRSKSGSSQSLNSNNSDVSQKSYLTYEQHRPRVEPVMPFRESEHPKQLYEGSQELIYISHIVDPHHLYVQRASQQGKVEQLLREFRNAVSLPKPATSHVAQGKIYLVYNKADNLWQRGRVVSIDSKDVNKPMYKVFCFDFGSTEVVSIDKLRLLPPGRIQSPPPFAIKCCLANCEPIHGTWTSDDSFLVQNIIDNKRAVIHVRNIRSTDSGEVTLECDIATFEDGVNLAHALAFHGRARIPRNVSYPKMMCLNEKPKIFITSSDYKQNSVEEVYITYIVNPDNFFVRKRHLQHVFEKLCEDLDREYSLAVNTGCIYLPEKDMVCVANVEKCGLGGTASAWARAVVLELPGRGRARLLLPDTGARVLVHWSALRRIREEFTVLKALATECHLAGVVPMNKQWSPASVQLLGQFKDRLLELHVEGNRNRGSLPVTLYDKSNQEDVICINREMIKYKFAYTFGVHMFNRNTDMEGLVYDNKSPLDDPMPRRKPKNRSDITILKKEQPAQPMKEPADLRAKDKGPLRLEAKVLNYQSPSVMYVSLVHQQKVFNELFEKIQKHYSTSKTQGRSDWREAERCCTVCAQSQTWRRAVVAAVDRAAERATVLYTDFACSETVPLAGLRDLPPEFAAVGDAAVACHLAGVLPAGGDDWPSITKEYLKDLLDKYNRVFITKKGDFKGKSMPVELWVYHTIQGEALEPNVSEWRCLNRQIIDQGLAIPDTSEEAGGGAVASANAGDDTLSFLNITGSVRDWLQMEPMPMKPLSVKPEPEPNPSSSSTPTPADGEQPHCSNANTIFISDWLPPEPLPSEEFTAMPTYIDDDGVIYLHDVSQQDTLDLIRKALDVRFKHPDPKAKFVKWAVGEPCIALFYLDDRFYRGRVVEVHEESSTCRIHYIDYGNEETCSFENLRKSIALYQIPTQAHKCVLNGIRPVHNKWDKQTLDYIHKSVVEKQCFVKVSGEPVGDLVPIDLKYDKLWINEHLVDFEMAVYADGSKPAVRKYAPTPKETPKLEETVESDSGPDYIVESDDHLDRSIESRDSVESSVSVPGADLVRKDWNELMQEEERGSIILGRLVTYPPYTETEFLCCIPVLNHMNKYELSVVHEHDTAATYEELYAQLQSDSHETALDGVYDNKACLALFPEDGKWYRATIVQYSEAKKLIKVKYVDHGNIEVIALNNVREIKDEYLKLPPATVTASFHGVEVNPDLDQMTVLKKMADTFLDKEDPFHARVIKHDVIPSVELRDVDGNLIYDNLIKEGIFLKCD